MRQVRDVKQPIQWQLPRIPERQVVAEPGNTRSPRTPRSLVEGQTSVDDPLRTHVPRVLNDRTGAVIGRSTKSGRVAAPAVWQEGLRLDVVLVPAMYMFAGRERAHMRR